MVRILTVGVLVVGSFLSMVSLAAAEDGGQYYRGRHSGVAPEQTPSILHQ